MGDYSGEEAIEELAKHLHFKMEHLWPAAESARWAELSEVERDYYRQCVKWLLAHKSLVATALKATR